MSAHPLRAQLLRDIRRVWPDPPRTGAADPHEFMATGDIVDSLVVLRPELWGTIRLGRPLSAQLFAAMLRSAGDAAMARTVRVNGRKGLRRLQVQALLDTIPAEVLRTTFTRPGPDGLLVEFGDGMLELLERGEGWCRIEAIVHQSAWDRAPIRAYRVTPARWPPTLAP